MISPPPREVFDQVPSGPVVSSPRPCVSSARSPASLAPDRTLAAASRPRLSGVDRGLVIGTFLFSGLAPADAEELLERCLITSHTPGDVLLREGDGCGQLLITLEGRLLLSRPAVGSAELGPGSVLGETTLLFPRPCRATVRALSPSRLLVVRRQALDGLLSARPGLGLLLFERVARRLSRQLERAYARLEEQGDEVEAAALF